MRPELLLPLINANRRRLVHEATRVLGLGDAEDAVQDAYVRALEAKALELNAAQAWLLTVVRHLAIDRLRRRQWMQQWSMEMEPFEAVRTAPSAEVEAARAKEAADALRLLAALLSPADGAAVLLHEVFEVGHADIAEAGGMSEAGGRQRLRRALARLLNAGREGGRLRSRKLDAREETVLRVFAQAMQRRDPQGLWAILRQPTVNSMAAKPKPASELESPPGASGIVQTAGQFGLVLSLDGITLCVLPLGVLPEREAEIAPTMTA